LKKTIIFTDLDGTLLDFFTYSFEAALPALRMIKENGIPLVFCSSKTRKEIEYYRERLGNNHPFISENGGGIFIPDRYFDFDITEKACSVVQEGGYHVLRLGARYPDLRKAIGELREEGFPVLGFGDMTTSEVASLAGLPLREAAMAKERDFDEPFILKDGPKETKDLPRAIEAKGLTFTEGRFFHLLGNSDKGRAVSILISLYRRRFDALSTVALGDSPNDIPMLMEVEHPVLVQRPGGSYSLRIDLPKLIMAKGAGPAGWNAAVIELLSLA
jgi:mannosyl-3-phosphoglycerate phosphatase